MYSDNMANFTANYHNYSLPLAAGNFQSGVAAAPLGQSDYGVPVNAAGPAVVTPGTFSDAGDDETHINHISTLSFEHFNEYLSAQAYLGGMTNKHPSAAPDSNTTMGPSHAQNQFSHPARHAQPDQGISGTFSDASNDDNHIGRILTLSSEPVNEYLSAQAYLGPMENNIPSIPPMPLGHHEVLKDFYAQLAARHPNINEAKNIWGISDNNGTAGTSNETSNETQAITCPLCPTLLFETEEARDHHKAGFHPYCKPCGRTFRTWLDLLNVSWSVIAQTLNLL
jgi:hypothetical protein